MLGVVLACLYRLTKGLRPDEKRSTTCDEARVAALLFGCCPPARRTCHRGDSVTNSLSVPIYRRDGIRLDFHSLVGTDRSG